MKLLLGCGDQHRDGFLRVDLREEVHPDFVADVAKLEFAPDESVTELVAEDLLEHMLYPHLVLTEWHRVLVPGGTLTVKVPNMRMLGRWLADGWKVGPALRNIYGGGRFGPEGMYDRHFHGWTPDTLRVDLEGAGFEVVSSDLSLNMTVKAVKQ